MKKLRLFFVSILLAYFTGGCSASKNAASTAALPVSWYSGVDNWKRPSSEADKAIGKVFETHMSVLDTTSRPLSMSTPWRLDAIRTDFSVSATGIFGILQAGGTSTVRGTWQRSASTASTAVVTKPATSAVHFSGQTKAQDLGTLLEPTVQTVAATKSIGNIEHLRSELTNKATQFFSLTQSISGLQPAGQWQVTGAELQLTVDASGNVTPTTAVGGEVDVYFDWNLTGPSGNQLVNEGLTNELNKLVQLFSREISLAINNSDDLKSSGFQLNDYYVGVEVSGSGQVGVASAGAAVTAKLYFTKVATASAVDIAPASTTEDKFKAGLDHAISMGAYFVKKARQVKSSQWKLAILETEFDASAGGGFPIATVTGTGVVVLDFTPNN